MNNKSNPQRDVQVMNKHWSPKAGSPKTLDPWRKRSRESRESGHKAAKQWEPTKIPLLKDSLIDESKHVDRVLSWMVNHGSRRFPESWGCPNSWMVHSGNYPLKMDDWRYPHDLGKLLGRCPTLQCELAGLLETSVCFGYLPAMELVPSWVAQNERPTIHRALPQKLGQATKLSIPVSNCLSFSAFFHYSIPVLAHLPYILHGSTRPLHPSGQKVVLPRFEVGF